MKKIISTLFILSLIFYSSPVFAFVQNDHDDVLIYNDNPPVIEALDIDEFSLSANDESEMEVITISTAGELIAFRDNVNSDINYSANKIFKLTNSIDLGGMEWIPIGYNSSYKTGDNLNILRDCAFKGIFDGQGNTVSNFKMSDGDYTYMGFFGTIHLGTVRNLNISDAYINFNSTDSSQLPQFAGLLSAFSNYAVFSNCNVSGDINIVNSSAFADSVTLCTGAISGVGLAQIDNCTYNGNISVNTLIPPYVGGIFGYASTSTVDFDAHIRNCSANANIDVKSVSGISAGGIMARDSFDFSEISNCSYSSNNSSSITVTQTYSEQNPEYASVYLGGIAGINSSVLKKCTVGNCSLDVTSESSATVGGITGKNEYEIDLSSSSANISVDLNRSSVRSAATPAIGGIAGINGGNYNTTSNLAPTGITPIIRNSSICDDISINIESDSGSSTVCGFIAGLGYAPSEISNCSSAAYNMKISSTNAGTYAGGICGLLNGGSVKYCHTSGSIGNNISSATSSYIGGIAGDANLKYYYTYDTSFGIESPLFTKAHFYGGFIENCSSDLNISVSGANSICAGGICGYLTNNYTQDGAAYYIKADRELGISKCSSTGIIAVTPTPNTFVGGLVGYSVDGKIYDSYADSSIFVNSDSSNTYIGGFVGTVYQNKHSYPEPTAILQNCYSSGTISLPNNCTKLKSGDFSGYIVKSPITSIYPQFINCYYKDSTTQNHIDGLIPLHDLSDKSAFVEWDFDNVWYMTDSKPILKHEIMGIYEYTAENQRISSLTISRPQNNINVYVAHYTDDRVLDVSVYEISDKNFVNEYFLFLPCNIDISDNFVIYVWNDSNEPLTAKLSI